MLIGIYRLWKLMENDVSSVNQLCVYLLLSCQDELISREQKSFLQSIQCSRLWKLLQEGFTSHGWKNHFKTGQFFIVTITIN